MTGETPNGQAHRGQALRILRKRARMSLRDVAKALQACGEPRLEKTTRGAISRWERGDTDITGSNLAHYLDAVGSDFAELQHALDGEIEAPSGDDSEVVTLPADDAWLREEDERVDLDLEQDKIRASAVESLKALGFEDMAREIEAGRTDGEE